MSERKRGWTGGAFDDDQDETQHERGPLADEDPTERYEPAPYNEHATPAGGNGRENLIEAVHRRTEGRATPPAAVDYPTMNMPGGGNYDEDDEEYGEEDEHSGGGGIADAVLDRLGSTVGLVIAGLLVLGLIAYLFFGRGGGEEQSSTQDAGQAPQGGQQQEEQQQGEPSAAGAPLPAVKDTGIVIEKPQEQDDSYFLEAGEIAWRGDHEKTEDGEVLKLKGATTAEFRRVPLDEMEIADGSLMTGTFGRAEPGKPWLHGMFDRTIVGGTETTEGTYKLGKDDKIILVGNYSDEREGGKVVRTYSERPPGTPLNEANVQRVSFEAPVGVPLPALVGREPSPLEGDAAR